MSNAYYGSREGIVANVKVLRKWKKNFDIDESDHNEKNRGVQLVSMNDSRKDWKRKNKSWRLSMLTTFCISDVEWTSHTQNRDVRNVTETSLSTEMSTVTGGILHFWVVKSSCSRCPTLTNDRWRSNGSRTHVLHLFADVRTRSCIETCRIEKIVTVNVRTFVFKRWLGIVFGKVSSPCWRLTHAQGLDRHIRWVRSNYSRWPRNDIVHFRTWLICRLVVYTFFKVYVDYLILIRGISLII